MNTKLKSLSLILAIGIFIGCSSNKSASINDGITESTDFPVASSKLSRNLNPKVTNRELKKLATDNNSFAFNMFSKLYETESGNLFFSPYSISEALVMTYAGAKGNTKTEMANVLNFNGDEVVLHNSFNALDLHLNHEEDSYILSVANSLWAQKDYSFVKSYLDGIKVNYGANISLLNFADSEKSRETINSWVSNKTHQKIKDLVPIGALNDKTKLVLTNSVYFKAQWLHNFIDSYTKDATFNLLDGTTKQTPFMSQARNFLYSQTDNYQAIDLPYVGERTSMLVILPKENKFQDVVTDIKNIYKQILVDLNESAVHLKMPKFEFTTGVYTLKDHFKALGMIEAFDSGADFSGMSSMNDLYIEEILHKAFIKVDEKGTEAAATTSVVINEKFGGVFDPIEMLIDRSFIFFIKDLKSEQILFAGVVKDPTF